nr:hypothetical protein BaRGS_030961 [Batillaria attramentaria]
MWIRFRSDETGNGTGFKASYTSGCVCRGTLARQQAAEYGHMQTGSRVTVRLKGGSKGMVTLRAHQPWTGCKLNTAVAGYEESGALQRRRRERGYDLIAMMSMSGSTHRTIISTDLTQPRAIVLDTMNGILFWTDWGQPEKIERANYDGSDRRVLHQYYLDTPNALAIDTDNPPTAPPAIHGYKTGDFLEVGDSLTMTCLVRGGKPLVTSVIFSCPDHPDKQQDIRGDSYVQSLLLINSLTAEDDGMRRKEKAWATQETKTEPGTGMEPADDYLHLVNPTDDYTHLVKPSQDANEYQHLHPVKPADDYLQPAKPNDDYLHPMKPADDYLHPVKPADDYLHPVKPADDYLHPVKPADDYLHPVKPNDD